MYQIPDLDRRADILADVYFFLLHARQDRLLRQTAVNPTPLAGDGMTAAAGPLSEEANHDEDYNPEPDKQLNDLLDGTERPGMDAALGGPSSATDSGGAARSAGPGAGSIAPDSLASAGSMDCAG